MPSLDSTGQWQENICPENAKEAPHCWNETAGPHHVRKENYDGGKLSLYCKVRRLNSVKSVCQNSKLTNNGASCSKDVTPWWKSVALRSFKSCSASNCKSLYLPWILVIWINCRQFQQRRSLKSLSESTTVAKADVSRALRTKPFVRARFFSTN